MISIEIHFTTLYMADLGPQERMYIIISDEIFPMMKNCPMLSSLLSPFQENTTCESTFFADTCTRSYPIANVP
jgi:hypothetical protein